MEKELMPWEEAAQELMPWEEAALYAEPLDIVVRHNFDKTGKYPEWMEIKDRMAIKNFANHNPMGSAKFLSEKYPDKEFVVGNNNEIYARDRGSDSNFDSLDPASGILDYFKDPKEFARDIGDIAIDPFVGAFEGATTAAGGLLGGTLGSFAGPIGTIGGMYGGAAAASAGASALTSEGKQMLGSAYGIPDNMNPDEVVTDSAIGGLSPFIFGIDKLPAGKKLIGNYGGRLIKQGKRAKSAIDLYNDNSKGLLKWAWDNPISGGARKTVSKLSGVEESQMKAYKKYADQYKNMTAAELGQKAADDYFDVRDQINGKMGDARRSLKQSMHDAGNEFDIGPALDTINNEIRVISNKPYPSDADLLEIEQLKKLKNDLFRRSDVSGSQNGTTVNYYTRKQDVDGVMDLRRRARNIRDFDKEYTSSAEKVAGDVYNKVGKLVDEQTGGESAKYKAEMKKLFAIEELMNFMDLNPNHNISSSKINNFRNRLAATDRNNIGEAYTFKSLEDVGVDLGNKREFWNGYNLYKNNSLTPISSDGATSTSRSVLADGAAEVLGAVTPVSEGALKSIARTTGPVAIKKTIDVNSWAEDQLGKLMNPVKLESGWGLVPSVTNRTLNGLYHTWPEELVGIDPQSREYNYIHRQGNPR